MAQKKVLIIEDNLADIETFKRGIELLEEQINLVIKNDGISARKYLERLAGGSRENELDMVVLDFNLPGIDGRSLLADFFNSDRFKAVPVIVVTTSGDIRDIRYAYENGANAYVIKPGEGSRFLDYIESIFNFWLRLTIG